MGWDEWMSFGWFAFTAPDLGGRRSHSPQPLCYTLYHTDMICTTSGGVSRRRHELMESCSATHIFSYRPSPLYLGPHPCPCTLTSLDRQHHLKRRDLATPLDDDYTRREGLAEASTHTIFSSSDDEDWRHRNASLRIHPSRQAQADRNLIVKELLLTTLIKIAALWVKWSLLSRSLNNA
jgi:hypothetical protein